jgi:hypothetical protein
MYVSIERLSTSDLENRFKKMACPVTLLAHYG